MMSTSNAGKKTSDVPFLALRACVFFLCLIAYWPAVTNPVLAGTSDDLPAALRALDQLRQGHKTPFAEVDRRADELLRKYPDPKDQGQIYFELVQVYGQSAGPPQRIIEYAKKALQLPLEPSQRFRLYTYWGDAVLLLKPAEPLADRRRAATVVFLDGLMQLRKFNLPEKPPEIPLVTLYDLDDGAREAEEQYRRDMAAVEQAHFVRAMIRHRDVLTGQIVWLYARKPFATDELRELATKTTKDPQLVARLVKAVEAKIKSTKYPPEVPEIGKGDITDSGGMGGTDDGNQ